MKPVIRNSKAISSVPRCRNPRASSELLLNLPPATSPAETAVALMKQSQTGEMSNRLGSRVLSGGSRQRGAAAEMFICVSFISMEIQIFGIITSPRLLASEGSCTLIHSLSAESGLGLIKGFLYYLHDLLQSKKYIKSRKSWNFYK